MRFLDYCQLHQLSPFEPASKEAHRDYQKEAQRERSRRQYGLVRNPVGAWLRELRNLNTLRDRAERSYKFWSQSLTELRVKGGDMVTMQPELDRVEREREAFEAADQALETYGAERPELFAEFNLRLELRDLDSHLSVLTRLVREARNIVARELSPLPPVPARVQDLERIAHRLGVEKQALERKAMADQEVYERTNLDMPPAERFAKGEELYKLGERIKRLDRQWDTASLNYNKAKETHDRRLAVLQAEHSAKHEAEQLLPVHEAALSRTLERINAIKAVLPTPPRAPLLAYRAPSTKAPPAEPRRQPVGGEDLA